ncbi:MAG: tRNA (adenosine(37)-N6)-threonylcarbamoyltransferase complex ATPase subunit type 1 TsaE [Acidobacteria bacterium]|nr:MAG: tRNA (adenosine(37)-N6)-threonylcarbamoyltransferase complex ATPase subunit type 1 TsaE [Acidobacteriota bacterium]
MISHSESDTLNFARDLAQSLSAPAHILLYGELGAGKTLFAKGLAEGFGVEDVGEVSSPTFTLINHYSGRMKVYHIDLYRIETGAWNSLGLEEIFDEPNAAVIVEWAEHLSSFETPGAIRVFISYVDDHSRKIEVC